MNLDNFFKAKSIAIIGVSRDPNKVGHVIFRNFIDAKFEGNIFIVNPNADEILGYEAHPSVLKIKDKIDLAIIATPASTTPRLLNECGKKGIKDVIIISSGFKEIGNIKLDMQLERIARKYKIKIIGPNCLGCFDAYTQLDSLFLPRYRLKRPPRGHISFVTQSGAIGSVILDLAAKEGYGFAKFISYGNALNIDESDIIKYLASDNETKVICLYIEAIQNGKKFLKIAKEITKIKPIIAIKGGLTEEGSKATLSHTGSLAGIAEIYEAAFKQANVIIAKSLEEMFSYARILERTVMPKGKKIMVITNGGGYGILATDSIIKNNLELAELTSETKKSLKKEFPKIVAIKNPLDLLGDATTSRYKIAIDYCLKDKNIDIMLLVILYQTPLITTDILDVVTEANDMAKKPIVVVSTGGEFTDVMRRALEQNNVPCFTFPNGAVKAIKQLVSYYEHR